MEKNLIVLMMIFTLFATSSRANDRHQIEVSKQPDQKWRFQRLTTSTIDGSVKISGRLTANLPTWLTRGHVNIAAHSPSGELIAETTTDYVPAILTHNMKKKGGVRFSATRDKALPPGSVFKVAIHREEPIVKTNPTHSGNIAR
ncbi:hypothetical protein [Cycloclasticus sp. PY97N]|jgi:hypothetical protein|uniref:hypothetical protein n=1 Tax=Cycloclasticus sp. PY97N TaxID=728003 RepID=UPI000BC314B2|nr:hypothetical protein [Cycloclasticus sp. PY97N]ATI03715.1 hypothetical protein CPC19_09645 [Cycloclasticus sp. PY97N]